jgi:hypothetical protein
MKGAIAVTAVNRLGAAHYEVVFSAQVASGMYTLAVGPDIRDLADSAMDQDGNGTRGEVPTDRFSSSFTLLPPAPAPSPPPVPAPAPSPTARFDFGTTSSPVATGYQQVTPRTRYTSNRGHGWQSGTVLSRDRVTGTALTRDFNFTTQVTFAVDVPNGRYMVTVTMGDARHDHDEMAVFLEGVQVSLLTTARGEFVSHTHMVTVVDGQLTLGLRDLGGSDVDVVLNSLVVATA